MPCPPVKMSSLDHRGACGAGIRSVFPPPGRLAVFLILCVPLLVRLHALTGRASLGAHLMMVAWEAPILVFLVALNEYSNRLHSLLVRIPVRVAAALAWLVLLADAIVFHLFDLRLAIPDVIRYGGRFRDATAFVDIRAMIVVVLCAGVLLGSRRTSSGVTVRKPRQGKSLEQLDQLAARPRRPRDLRGLWLLGGVLALVLGSRLVPRDDGDLYGWRVQNLLSLSTQSSLFRSYPPTFLDSVQSELALYGGCGGGAPLQGAPNVLLVFLESFSSHFSPTYGGSEAVLPEFDRISQRGLRFTRFLANGFTTEHGLIAVLGGRLPVFPAEVAVFSLTGNTAFAGHYGLTSSLPACADSLGYYSEFLTAGDLSFTNKGEWLRSVGFDRVEGHDAPSYRGLPRGAFGSVSDSALYVRVMDRLETLRADSIPFLMVVEGVESHGPYPRGTDGMIASLRSADVSLGRFFDQLERSSFLDEGLVLLVSDHRVQRSLTSAERKSFGGEAASRVPALLLGNGVTAGEDSLPRHQLDVRPTLLRRMGGRVAPTSMATPMTDPPGVRCIPWLHGGRRDEMLALCDTEYIRIRLDAERTRVVEGTPSRESDDLIKAIHRTRIDGAEGLRPPGEVPANRSTPRD